MSGFLIGAFALLALALAFLLVPMLRSSTATAHAAGRDDVNIAVLRDQLRELDADLDVGVLAPDQYASAKHDLELRVTQDIKPAREQGAVPDAPGRAERWTAPVIGLALPVAAMLLYTLVGSPAALESVYSTSNGNGAHRRAPLDMDQMVAQLAQRLRDEPDNIEGWHMLARSYNALERYQDAAHAYAHLATRLPQDADVLADYADTLAMVRNRSLQGEPQALIERALAADPDHIKALALAGTAAFERGDYKAAVSRWQRIVELLPPDAEMTRSTVASIAEAKRRMGQGDAIQSPAPPRAAADRSPQVADAARIEGVVELDPALRARVADGDTLFVSARAVDGPPMPLAVLRASVRDMPLAFVLDDSMSMASGARLSDFPVVVVEARISKSGSAARSKEDISVHSEPLPARSSGLRLRIGPETSDRERK